MSVEFEAGQQVRFAGATGAVIDRAERNGTEAYLIENGPLRLPMWVPADVLDRHQQASNPTTAFPSQVPHVLAIDNFFHDPDEVRAIALAQDYAANLHDYKGLRSQTRLLWPHLREEFSRLLGRPLSNWLENPYNGIFQQTSHDDPLVWHHDTQTYAGAVYLTPDAPAGSGTSFWRDRTHGCRRRPRHPFEQERLGSEEAVEAAESVVYDPPNFLSPDNWELVESVAGIYNRLVLWDASLIHSATSYENFTDQGAAPTRLVQLFFFDA